MTTSRAVKGYRGFPVSPATERFWAKVDPCRTDGCMVWIAHLNKKGYGRFWDGTKLILAYHFLAGSPPIGLQWDHLCLNHACVNSDHLEAVSCLINVRRAPTHNANKTHCPQGHEYTEENTYRGARGNIRHCRICLKDWDRVRAPINALSLAKSLQFHLVSS